MRITDQSTLEEIFAWVNEIETEKQNRLDFVVKRLPSVLELLKVYFGDSKYSFFELASKKEAIETRPMGVEDSLKMNYQRFVIQMDHYADQSEMKLEWRVSQFSGLMDWMCKFDSVIIMSLVLLEEIEIFTELGLAAYEKLMGK